MKMEKVYVVFERMDNAAYYEDASITLKSIHKSKENAELRRKALDDGLNDLMRGWGFSYYVKEVTLEA